MSGAAWVCDSCDTNNLADAAYCRLCQRPPGTATGIIRAVTRPPSPPKPGKSLEPRFVESKHAVAKQQWPAATPERPRITLTGTVPPPSSGHLPAPSPPRPRPRPRPLPPPTYSTYPARQGSGCLKFLVIAVLVIGVVASCNTLIGKLSDVDLPTSAPTGPAAACPAAAAAWLPNGGSGAVLVAAYTTERHVITVCRDRLGQLYYDGQIKGAAAMDETHVSIPAERTTMGFMARNNSYVYEISGAEIIVSRNGTVLSRSPLTRTGP
jgi:hypothetical protein